MLGVDALRLKSGQRILQSYSPTFRVIRTLGLGLWALDLKIYLLPTFRAKPDISLDKFPNY